MTYSRDCLYDFTPVEDEVFLAGGNMRMMGWGKLDLDFESPVDDGAVTLLDVAYVPTFDMNLFSLQALARAGHTSHVTPAGTSVINGRIFFPPFERLHGCKATRVPHSNVVAATSAPGDTSRKTFDINHFHCCYGHLLARSVST